MPDRLRTHIPRCQEADETHEIRRALDSICDLQSSHYRVVLFSGVRWLRHSQPEDELVE